MSIYYSSWYWGLFHANITTNLCLGTCGKMPWMAFLFAFQKKIALKVHANHVNVFTGDTRS